MPDQLSMFDDAPDDAPVPSFAARRRSRPDTRHELVFALRPDAPDACRLLEAARRAGIGGAPLDAGRLHVSLFGVGDYLGDAFPGAHVARLLRAAGSVALEGFELVFDEAASFTAARAFVLKASAEETLAALRDVRLRLGEALANAGVPMRAGKITPHMTMAYGEASMPAARIPALAWRPAELALIDSYVGERHHESLGRWPLAI